MDHFLRTTPEAPLLVSPAQLDFPEVVLFHHFHKLLQLVEIKRISTGGTRVRHGSGPC
jgi:hypothetical protein